MRTLLDGRGDLLLVTGLGSTTYDAAAVADDERNFYLWGAMGAAAMVGLGLAIARPERRVLVVTGDGEMLMGLGALATIGVQRPPNLAIAVFDNARYAETGMQPSHTDFGVSLTGVARSCGIEGVFDISDEAGLREFAARAAAIRADDIRAGRDPRRRAAARAAVARRRVPEKPLPPRARHIEPALRRESFEKRASAHRSLARSGSTPTVAAFTGAAAVLSRWPPRSGRRPAFPPPR